MALPVVQIPGPVRQEHSAMNSTNVTSPEPNRQPPPVVQIPGPVRQEHSAMNSTLKLFIPLALLVAVVFAVTYFSAVVPPPNDKPSGEGGEAITETPPLIFFTNSRKWDPVSESLPNREFPGYFLAGEHNEYHTAFWFRNPNRGDVAVQLKGVSCSACSGGNLAPIPPEALKHLLQVDAVSLLPMGPVSLNPAAVSGAAANLITSLKWQKHKFLHRDEVQYSVPGLVDADGWSPQWGIMDLTFEVHMGGKTPLTAVFDSRVVNTSQVGQDKLEIAYVPAGPFELSRANIDLGEMTEQTPPQTHEIVIYSTTRTRDEMPNFSIRVTMTQGAAGDPGPFVTTGPLVPIPEEELIWHSFALSRKDGVPVRVKSAFKFPIIIQTKVGDRRADIGRLDRTIWITQGTDTKELAVRGNLHGPIYLTSGTELRFGSFSEPRGTTETFDITTEQAGVELAVVTDQTVPDFMKVTLEKQPDLNGLGAYKIKLHIPENRQSGEIRDGVVVLEVKGPNPRRVRFPVKGFGKQK